jgi:hypothetical protein
MEILTRKRLRKTLVTYTTININSSIFVIIKM